MSKTTRAVPVSETHIWRTPVGREYVAVEDHLKVVEALRALWDDIGERGRRETDLDTEAKVRAALDAPPYKLNS